MDESEKEARLEELLLRANKKRRPDPTKKQSPSRSTPPSSLQCPLCRRTFDKPSQLQTHTLQTHDKVRLFQCPTCPADFFKRSDLRQHLRSVHLGIRRHSCQVCNRRFSHVSNLNRHARTHSNEKAFGCKDCDRSYLQASGLRKHVMRQHGGSSSSSSSSCGVNCGICGRGLSHVDVYRKHLRGVHCLDQSQARRHLLAEKATMAKDRRISRRGKGDDLIEQTLEASKAYVNDAENEVYFDATEYEVPDLPTSQDLPAQASPPPPAAAVTKETTCHFACTLCPKHFRRKASLLQHLGTHDGVDDRKTECKFCGLRFAWKTTLNRHVWTVHDSAAGGKGGSSSKCRQCKRTFQSESLLQVHLRRDHLKERPFKCGCCDKAFFKKDDLSTHSKVHSGEKSHECEQCGKNFSHRSNLKRHVKIHTGAREFHCPHCDKEFTQKHALQEHCKRYH